MIARAVHHVSFSVSDLSRARKFYEEVLGLGEIPRPDLGALAGAWYRAGNAEVHLIVRPGARGDDAPSGLPSPIDNHCAFAIEDYDAARDALRARGLEVLETSRERGQLWVHDPDGNVIELIAPPR
jgi:catechol 2,3-dioxygenase-like lactoylglutathione lyase family enzyme